MEISNGNLLVRIRQRTDSVGGMDWNREVGEMAAGQSLVNRILFATDFSTCARHAEEFVAFLSKAYGATVEVVHVLELYPGMYAAVEDHGETDERLADAVRRLQRPTISVTDRQMIGIPSVKICAAAIDYHADVIVMGTHGRRGSNTFSWEAPRSESSLSPHVPC